MRGAALPAALILAALGLALSFAPRRALVPCLLIAGAVAVVASNLPLPRSATEAAFLFCWAGVVLAAAAVHSPRGLGRLPALALAAITGLGAGVVIAVEGSPADLATALPLLALALPGVRLVRNGMSVALKVVASWLIAVSILAGTLSFAPVTPGYVADHLE